VTIDNIGVGIWLWIIGGIIIGRSSLAKDSNVLLTGSKNNKRNIKSSTEVSLAPNIGAFALAVLVLIVCVPLLNNSSKLVELKYNLKSLDQNSYTSDLLKTANDNSGNPQTLANLADFATQKNDLTTALTISKMLGIVDSRSFYASFLPAVIYEGTDKRELAIPYREKLLITDKWNTGNMLELVKSYIGLKDTKKAVELANKIEKLYPGSKDSKTAESLIETLTTP
jgi:tetratricopeptide (TPR) repeat protein